MATAYLRSWLPSALVGPAEPAASAGPSISITIDDADEDDGTSSGEETERGDPHDDDPDPDLPPAFPSLNSAQRTKPPPLSPSPPARPTPPPALSRPLSDAERMPPPPPPTATLSALASGPAPGPSLLGVRSPSPGSSLALPPSTTKPPARASKKRGKVALTPGHGPLDWGNLKASGRDLRGVDALQKVTLSILKQHNKADDAWTAINGKVYNITAYLPYHPGGEKELMRVAGRDGTKLFALTHAWVNADFMLDTCMVGFLVADRP